MRGWDDARSLAFERGGAVKGIGRTGVPGRRIPLCVGGDTQAVLVNRTGGGVCFLWPLAVWAKPS